MRKIARPDARRWMSLRRLIRSWSSEGHLRALGDDSAVFPHVERCSVHSRRAPRRFGGTLQRSSDTGGALRVPVRVLRDVLAFHGPDSIRGGGRVELSYTVHASANGRYVLWKFDQLLEKRRRTSAFFTLWPPCRTLPAMRRTAYWGDTNCR